MLKKEKLIFRILFVMITASMALTEVLLLVQGRWREAIPLHLCSLSGIAAAVLAAYPRDELLDFLWYLGIPGAALALLFPAPASSIFQKLFNISYYMTHVLILIIPLCRMIAGMRPCGGKTFVMMFVLLGIAAVAYGVNRLLGTDFLFLMAPPEGTPLEIVFKLGYPLYLMALFALMLLCLMMMDIFAKSIGGKTSVTKKHFKLYKTK